MRPRTIALLFLVPVAFAQEPAEPSIKVDVSLVNVAFIVRDHRGVLDRSLTKDDIEIYEDGVRQDVRFFGKSGDLPLRLALVTDMSGSQQKFIKDHHRDIERFLKSALTPRDQAMLICFGNRIRVVSDFSPSVDTLMDGLEAFPKSGGRFPELEPDDTRSGGTALFDAVYLTARDKLTTLSGERKALILLSDGEDNSSAHDLLDAIEEAQAADSVIYTVRYTEMRNHRLPARARYGIREMDRLAKETGGAAFDASGKPVDKALAQVAEELRAMYDIGYMSTNPNRDGRFRNVVIRIKDREVTVRSKPGYFAR
jgi:Ca-activated chloride channel family protein